MSAPVDDEGIYPAARCYLETAACRDVELVLGFARLDPADIREGIRNFREIPQAHRLPPN